jgi:hypothetical protein
VWVVCVCLRWGGWLRWLILAWQSEIVAEDRRGLSISATPAVCSSTSVYLRGDPDVAGCKDVRERPVETAEYASYAAFQAATPEPVGDFLHDVENR